MQKLDRELTRDKQCWAPHYNDVQTHVDLRAGTRIRIVAQENVSWDDPNNPGGHNYYQLEYEQDGVRKTAWTRTYDFQDRDTFSQEVRP